MMEVVAPKCTFSHYKSQLPDTEQETQLQSLYITATNNF
jgi:hypothetical protein